jgi:hypothetical protein
VFLEIRERSNRSVKIDFAPVTDAHYPHFMSSVIHFVDDAIVAHADAPVMVGADNLAASGGSRVVGQTLEVNDYAAKQLRV